MALRTVWLAQPRFRAITAGRCSRLDANRIWLRRRVKASKERNPASIFVCSSGINVLTKRGAFICCFFFLARGPRIFSTGEGKTDLVQQTARLLHQYGLLLHA